MEEKEILEGNKLIAEFMGCKSYEDDRYGIMWHHPIKDKVVKSMEYHSSWDWLMPVVEKIESVGCIVEISLCLGKTCRITKGNFKEGIKYTEIYESNSTIESVYMSAIEFIKYYNSSN